MLNTDQLPYGVVMAEEVPRQALVNLLRVDPLDTEIALILTVLDLLRVGVGGLPLLPLAVLLLCLAWLVP